MASKSERLITEALGHPTSTQKFSVTGTTVSGVLAANSTHRYLSTEDAHIKWGVDNDAADANDMLLVGGVPEVFTTTANRVVINVLRSSTSGSLYVTLLHSRGE